MNEQRTHIDRYMLAALRAELEALGMVVVPFGDELHVRLPMLEYVKIRVEDGSLHCTSWVGLMPRSSASWMLSGVCAAAIAGLMLTTGVTPATLTVAFVAIISVVSGGLRHILSDNVVTRIQMAWLRVRDRLPIEESGTITDPSRAIEQLSPGLPRAAGQRQEQGVHRQPSQ